MMSNKFIRRAIELAKHSIDSGGGPFAAVIVKQGKIIGEGFNQVTQNNDPTAHAEIIAIRHACKELSDYQLKDCIIYTSSEPCPMCLSAIYWSRLTQVYYANSYQQAQSAGFDDQFIFEELALAHKHKKINISQIESTEVLEQASNIFTLWNNKIDKKEY
ncbi:MAG: nucleoside deaminase [Pseudomonadota bacterium]